MPLDPYARRILSMVTGSVMPEDVERTPAALRQGMLHLARVVDAKDVAVANVEDHELPAPASAVPVRVYTPLEAGRELPGLIYFHGGMGVFCSSDTHDGLCRLLANASGCRIASVEYRLAPENAFPAGLEDSWQATRWIAAHAAEWGMDPTRIAVGGDSHGGTLAAVVCQLARAAGEPRLALQLLLCPVMDLSAETASWREFGQGHFLDRTMLHWAIRQYCPAGVDIADPRLSPLRATDFDGLPPTHVHTAEFDPLRDEGKAYAETLARSDVDVRYVCHAGMIHHFYCMAGAIPAARAAIEAVGGAVKDVLR